MAQMGKTSSGKQEKSHGVLRAKLAEVEPGLFCAEYPGELNGSDEPAGGQLPDRHIATSRDAVQSWVEAMATSLGYERVDWV